MGNSATALRWLEEQLDFDNIGDITGRPYKIAVEKKFNELLNSTTVKPEHRKGLRAVMNQKVFDLRTSEKEVPDFWLSVRKNIRTPYKQSDRLHNEAERVLKKNDYDYAKTIAELKKKPLMGDEINRYEKKLREQQNAFINRLRREIVAANNKEDVRKLKDSVLFEVQKEKAKPATERLLKEKTLNNILKQYQEKRNQYFTPQSKGVEAAKTSIVREYESSVAPKATPRAVRTKTEAILYEQPWLGKQAAEQAAKDAVRREEKYNNYLEAIRKRTQGEISAYDLVLQKYAAQTNDPVLSLFDKENLLRQFETKNGKPIKNPRIIRTSRIETDTVPFIREQLKEDIANERSRYEKFRSDIELKKLAPRFKAASVSPIISTTPEERTQGVRVLKLATEPKKQKLLVRSPAREAAIKKLSERNKKK